MGLKDQEETSRVGTKWLPEEDAKLVEEMSNNLSYDEIALQHKRTSTGIKSRVISQIIYPIYTEGNKTMDEISIEYRIEKEIIEKYINKLEIKNAIKTSVEKNKLDNNKSDETKPKKNNRLLFDKMALLENKMLTIEEKLDYIINIITK
jgi:hypothetical protein